MLSGMIDNGSVKFLGVTGSIPEIASDVFLLIHSIYEELSERDEDSAEFFKLCCEENIELAFLDSDDLKEETEKRMKERKESINGLKDIMNSLRELDELIEKLKGDKK